MKRKFSVTSYFSFLIGLDQLNRKGPITVSQKIDTPAADLISDLSSILRGNIKYPFAISYKERKKIKFESIQNQLFSAYIRLDVKDKHGVLSNITKVLSKNKISVKRLIQNPIKSKKFSSIIIITHNSLDKYLSNTMKNLSKKKYLIRKPKIIRIEE